MTATPQTTLDPRFRGDDASVAHRRDCSDVALGRLRDKTAGTGLPVIRHSRESGSPVTLVRKTLDPRFHGADASVAHRRDCSDVALGRMWDKTQGMHLPVIRHSRGSGSPVALVRKTLDPRFRGDDAAVSNRSDPSGLALGHPRHLTTTHLSRSKLSASCTSSMFFFIDHASAC
jgi:hypothetical protein